MDLLAKPELTDRLAAAYALGTLRGGARRRFETIARQSPAVRAQVIIWQERFAAMTELQPVHLPNPNVWKRIENLLPAQQAAPHREPATGPEPALLERLRRVLALWRGAALASAAVAVVAVVVGGQLGMSLEQQQAQLRAMPEIQYVAVLADDRQAPMLLATVDPKHNMLTLKRVAQVEAGPDRSLQLWALAPGAPPRSLGMIGAGHMVRLPMPQMAMEQVPALAVSLEPRGGAPAGSGPTGPVMYQGPLLRTTL